MFRARGNEAGGSGDLENGLDWRSYAGVWEVLPDFSQLTPRKNVLPVADALGQLAAPVQLRAGLADSTLTLQWPFSGAGLALAMTTDLSPTAAWQPVTNPVQSTGLVLGVTLPGRAAHTRFYRLQSR